MKTQNDELNEKLEVSEELRERVIRKILECIQKCNKGLKEKFDIPILTFRTKSRNAGVSDYSNYWIDINPILLNENPDFVINDTVPHEMAHLISYLVYGNKAKGHGYYWKYVAQLLGVDTERQHDLDVSTINQVRKPRRTFLYKCKCEHRDKPWILSDVSIKERYSL